MHIDLDHAAIAAHDLSGPLHQLITQMGAVYRMGGPAPGFQWRQVQVGADGMVIELLEPYRIEHNDFLERFLQRRGEGPHHLTFKTTDIRATIDSLQTAGYAVVNVDLSDPGWQEAFVMPASAGGTVVQLAQEGADPKPPDPTARLPRRPSPPGVPEPDGTPATLRRVVLNTPDIAASLALYRDVLQGTVAERQEGWIELTWPTGGRLRFEQRPDAPAGVARYECEHSGPDAEHVIAGARFVLRTAG